MSETRQPCLRRKALAALYRKEASAYFNTPAAYIVSVVFLLITGYLFAQPLFLVNQASLAGFMDLSPLLLTFFVPAITMRLVAEEMKSGTLEILQTLPVDDHEILLAKFLAAVTLIWAVLGLTVAYPAAVGALGKLDWGAAAVGYLGLGLSGAMLASAGLFASTLTRNQVVAFILGFLLAFSFYIAGKVDVFMPHWLAPVTEFLGLDSHIDNMARGVLDTRDLLYYLSLTGLFLFLSFVRLQVERTD